MNKKSDKNKDMNTTTIISIIAVILIIIGAVYFSSSSKPKVNNAGINNNNNNNKTESNVSIVDGVQIIEIQAKGGYTPRKSIAKAGIPTIIRFQTSGTFDCSSSVRIPSMKIFDNLAQSGNTDIDLGTQKAGELNGSCGMGMYPFEIDFQN